MQVMSKNLLWAFPKLCGTPRSQSLGTGLTIINRLVTSILWFVIAMAILRAYMKTFTVGLDGEAGNLML